VAPAQVVLDAILEIAPRPILTDEPAADLNENESTLLKQRIAARGNNLE
jgi:hypothetical protein